MIYLGVMLLIISAIAIVAKRGGRGLAVVAQVVVTLISVPLAVFGVLVMGFSRSVEDTRLGALLLFASLIVGGGIAWMCLTEMKRNKAR